MKGETMKDKKKIIGVIAIIVAILAIAVTIGMYFYRNAKLEEKKETAKGKIELIVTDQNKVPANEAATFELKQVFSEDNKQSVMEITPRKDGVVDFYDVPEGEYELEIVKVKEGYTFAEDKKVQQFHVTANQINTINWSCTREGRLLQVTTVDKEKNPIPDVKIDLYDKEGVYMLTGKTNAEGKTYFNLEEDGEYYFQLDKDCEKAKEYQLDETLYKVTIDAENPTFSTTVVNEKR